MELIDVDYNFVSLLNDLVNMVQTKADEKGLTFKLDVDRNIPRLLHGDEIRIKQVITNILSNAVKYTKEGGVICSISCDKAQDQPDHIMLHVSVKDTGIGIKKEDLDRLFVAFERIEEKRNRNIEGTGLGMAIAQSFLNMMGSKIRVDSEYGKGSVFSFDLLQKVVDWEPLGDFDMAFKRFLSERKHYRALFTAPESRILVVDDTPVNLTVFMSLLKDTKMKIDTAENGDDCISMFRQKHYDIIFLDHMMPEKDGIETIREMKKCTDTPNQKTPVICLTANAVSGMRQMYIDEGFDDYLTKPIDTEKLDGMLLKYLPKDKVMPVEETEEKEEIAVPKFLYEIEEIDVNNGIASCGDAESYLLTIKTYLDTAEKTATEIEKYWEVKDLKNTTTKVHALKSTSRVIGAAKLGDFAERLEKAGKNGDEETLSKELPQLLIDYRKLVSALLPVKDISIDEDKSDENVESADKIEIEKSILIVDDDVTYLKMVQKWLSAYYRISAVKSGKQALSYLGHHTPDLILLDYDMPEMSGAEVAEQIRKISADKLPIFFLTGADEQETRDKLMSLEPQGFILKSSGRDVIVEQVNEFFS